MSSIESSQMFVLTAWSATFKRNHTKFCDQNIKNTETLYNLNNEFLYLYEKYDKWPRSQPSKKEADWASCYDLDMLKSRCIQIETLKKGFKDLTLWKNGTKYFLWMYDVKIVK